MSPVLLVWIAIGGGVGAVTRFAASRGIQEMAGTTFPLGTMAVNVLGCLLVGFLAERLSGAVLLREEYRLAILVGFMGGFTTFSTFGWETLGLLTGGHAGVALLNVLLSNGLGLVAVWVGWKLALGWPGG
jgi:CrcB protein